MCYCVGRWMEGVCRCGLVRVKSYPVAAGVTAWQAMCCCFPSPPLHLEKAHIYTYGTSPLVWTEIQSPGIIFFITLLAGTMFTVNISSSLPMIKSSVERRGRTSITLMNRYSRSVSSDCLHLITALSCCAPGSCELYSSAIATYLLFISLFALVWNEE